MAVEHDSIVSSSQPNPTQLELPGGEGEYLKMLISRFAALRSKSLPFYTARFDQKGAPFIYLKAPVSGRLFPVIVHYRKSVK